MGTGKIRQKHGFKARFVSIQLMSPASGDLRYLNFGTLVGSFHSINVPSEWGLLVDSGIPVATMGARFHSINVPSEWGRAHQCLRSVTRAVSIQLMSPASGDEVDSLDLLQQNLSFHSINVPSEWGLIVYWKLETFTSKVSIQLMSPASGDRVSFSYSKTLVILFPFN